MTFSNFYFSHPKKFVNTFGSEKGIRTHDAWFTRLPKPEPMSRGEDLNLQPMVYKTIALPLSYLGLGDGEQAKQLLSR
jgi:hypothetical protein